MIELFTIFSTKKLNPYNITQLQLSQVPLEERRRKKFAKTYVQSPFNKDNGIENCLFFKVYKNQCPKYLLDIIPQSICQYRTRNAHNIPYINVKHQFFKNSYLPSTLIEWNKLDSNIHNSETLNIFKSKILKFIRPTANSIFGCHNPLGVKLLTRLRLGRSHLREHKF